MVASRCPSHISEELGFSPFSISNNNSRVTQFLTSFLDEIHHLLVYIPSVIFGLNPFYIK